MTINNKFYSFYYWVAFCYLSLLHFIYPFITYMLLVFYFLWIVLQLIVEVQMSLWHIDFISFEFISKSGIPGSYRGCVLIFEEPPWRFFMMAVLIYIPTNNVQGLSFVCIFYLFLVFLIIDVCGKLIPHYALDLHFLGEQYTEYFSMDLLSIFISSF